MEKNTDETHISHKKEMVHAKSIATSHNMEDFVTSIGVIFVSTVFIVYVAIVTYVPSLLAKNEDPRSATPQKQSTPIFPFMGKNTNCKKMNGNFEACVKSQEQGSGCSWYASCDACVVGSHDGRSREEICEK